MNIAVIGAGAIGAVIAGLLSKAGVEVCLVGRASQVDAIRQDGLRIKQAGGLEVIKVNTAARLEREYDLVIFTVKTQDLETAYQDNHRFLEGGCVLTTQNGVQSDNLLSTHFEPKNMYGSIVMFGATYVQPGEVTLNFPGDWIIGKPYTVNDVRIHEIAGVLGRALPVVVAPNIMGMKWTKLFVNFNNCLPALIGKSMQETFADMALCRLSVTLLKEGVEVVQQAGIEMVSLPSFPVERILGLAQMPVDQAAGILHKTLTGLSQEPLYGSILQSIMRGRASEIDFINGEVVQVASGLRSEAPLNKKIVRMVHEVENSKRYFAPEDVKREFNLN